MKKILYWSPYIPVIGIVTAFTCDTLVQQAPLEGPKSFHFYATAVVQSLAFGSLFFI